MLTLHHLENSQSLRILWLLEELELDYEFRMYDRDVETRLAPAEYKAISPLGTAPVITDGELVLAETNAIIDYLLDTYGEGRMRPAPGSAERIPYLFWFHAAQGSFQPLLTTRYVFDAMRTKPPFPIRGIVAAVVNQVEKAFLLPRLDAIYQLIEKDLAERTWFAGEELTAADIVMGFTMEFAAVRAGMDERYPHAQGFLQRMRARPAYQRALEKDGKFKPF